MQQYSLFGGTGFVGGCFAQLFQDKSKLIDRESRTPETNDIIYFISTTHNYHVFEDVHKDIDTNLTVLVDVLKNLKPGESTFNFISSWFVYGEGNLPVNEESPCHPKGFYSITKRCAEQLVESYCKTFGINYRILRLCNVYGRGDLGASKKKNALQFLVDKLKNNEAIDLYHNGEFYRDYMHVTDVAKAIATVCEKGELNSVYNIGSGQKILFKDVIDIAYKTTESKSQINVIQPPEFHKTVQVKDFYMSTDKLFTLGFSPEVSIQKGIEELCH
jgi:nucleoside-diphosphate-sugar epimerase